MKFVPLPSYGGGFPFLFLIYPVYQTQSLPLRLNNRAVAGSSPGTTLRVRNPLRPTHFGVIKRPLVQVPVSLKNHKVAILRSNAT